MLYCLQIVWSVLRDEKTKSDDWLYQLSSVICFWPLPFDCRKSIFQHFNNSHYISCRRYHWLYWRIGGVKENEPLNENR